MARTEEQMQEEMTGMAALPAENTPMEEKEPSIDMETMMGNFMYMSDQERQIVGRLIASPAGQLIDRVFGEPLIARLATQLDEGFTLGDEEATPAPTEGIMGAQQDEEAPAPLV